MVARREFLRVVGWGAVLGWGCSSGRTDGVDGADGADGDDGDGRGSEVGADDAGPDGWGEVRDGEEVGDTRQVCVATEGDALGPYYLAGAPGVAELAEGEAGQRLVMRGRVVDEACAPVEGALFEVWQADHEGAYHDERLRAALRLGADGAYALSTIMPGRYLQATGYRPAHLHYRVSAPGFRTLVTQVYFAGDPYLAPADSCATCGSDDPGRIVALTPEGSGVAGWCEVVLRRG